MFLCFQNYLCVEPCNKKGGLLLLWNENANVSILTYYQGHIDCLISHTPFPFYFTGFYGNPNHNLRFNSWLLLNKIAKTHSNRYFGWLVGGDFNETLYDEDKRGGLPRNLNLCNASYELRRLKLWKPPFKISTSKKNVIGINVLEISGFKWEIVIPLTFTDWLRTEEEEILFIS